MEIADSGVICIANSLPRLDLTGCLNLTVTAVVRIAGKLPGIISLCLAAFVNISDIGIGRIGDACHELQVLNLRMCANIINVRSEKISQGCHLLVDLNLNSCSHINDSGIGMLVDSCPHLTI